MTVPDAPNRTLAAAGAILVYAMLIGFTDNYVRVIAEGTGLWQFHAMRSAMAFALVGALALPLGLRLRPKNLRAVAARSAIHACAMVLYFGSLAFLTVAETAAGLFTAPIFVLVLSRFVYGHALGPVRVVAVATGFLGVILVLAPGAGEIGWLSAAPVAAGALYAMGNLATREWCPGESAETLTVGFFAGLGVVGLAGMAVLAMLAPEAPSGPEGFLLRGPGWPSGEVLFWTAVQAAGSLLGVGLMIRAYQLAEASRVAVFEYVILPSSAFWSWALWGETVTPLAAIGMALIIAAGAMIALRAAPAARSPGPA